MEKSKRNAKLLIAFVIAYIMLIIIGGAINYAVSNESFGAFVQSLFGGVYGVFVFAMYIVLIWAIKVLKGKDTIISNKIMAWILAGIFIWVFFGAAYSYVGLITDAVWYSKNNISHTMSDQAIGNLVISVMWVITTIVVFILLDFYKVINSFFKEMKGGKKVMTEPVSETSKKSKVKEKQEGVPKDADEIN